MSATVLYVLNGKSVSYFEEFENSWGTGPALWDYLLEKHHGKDLPFYFDRGKALEELVRGKLLDSEELMAEMFMRDGAYIPKERLLVAAEACETLGARIPSTDTVNHWPEIGRSLRRMSGTRLSRHAVGACLTATDIQDDWRWSAGMADNTWSIFRPI